jgi:hypothetical protein
MLVLNKVNYFIDPGIEQLGVITYQSQPQLGFLPQVVIIHFGDGGVEAVSDLVNKAFNNFPLAFERLVIGQVQGYSGQSNNHCLR